MTELSEASAGEAQEHLELVGSLTDGPSCAPFAGEGSHAWKGQVASPQSYTCTTNEQSTNTSRIPYERKGTKWKELAYAITYFIAKDSLPMHTYI